MDEQIIYRAAKMVKIIRLAGTPGMDIVAIRLNCEPTYDELQIARSWAKGFEIAAQDGSVFDLVQQF